MDIPDIILSYHPRGWQGAAEDLNCEGLAPAGGTRSKRSGAAAPSSMALIIVHQPPGAKVGTTIGDPIHDHR